LAKETEPMRTFTARLCAILFVLTCISAICYADTEAAPVAEPYTEDEFPQWALDARRTEIIMFGSLPFVTLGTTLAYTTYRYFDHDFSSSYIPNPFAKSSDSANLDTTEQMNILKTAVCVSIGLGLFDLVCTLIKRKNAEKMQQQKEKNIPITITPLNADQSKENGILPESRSQYLYGGMTNVVF